MKKRRRKMVYQYILFDLDGTIINSAEGIIKCVKYALKSFGIDETDDERIKAFIGPPLVWSFQEFYHFSPEEAKKATEKYRERYRKMGKHWLLRRRNQRCLRSRLWKR